MKKEVNLANLGGLPSGQLCYTPHSRIRAISKNLTPALLATSHFNTSGRFAIAERIPGSSVIAVSG